MNIASRLEQAAPPDEILISNETFANVRDQIFCAEHGDIKIKGIGHPIAAYKVEDTLTNLERDRHRIREDRPNLKIDLHMTPKERNDASSILRRALNLLARDDIPPRIFEGEGSRL